MRLWTPFFLLVAIPALHAQDGKFHVSPEKAAGEVVPLFVPEDGPGGVLTVIKGKECAYQGGFGRLDFESEAKCDPATYFRLPEMTHDLARVLALTLDEVGEVDLDQPLHEVLPAFRAFDDPVRLRHMIKGGSGLRSLDTLFYLRSRRERGRWTRARALDLLSEQRGRVEAAEKQKPVSRYDTDTLLLVAAMEAVSKRPVGELLDEFIFDAHGMSSAVCLSSGDAGPEGSALPVRWAPKPPTFVPDERLGLVADAPSVWFRASETPALVRFAMNPAYEGDSIRGCVESKPLLHSPWAFIGQEDRRFFVRSFDGLGVEVAWIGANPMRGGFTLCRDVGRKILVPPDNLIGIAGGAGGKMGGRFGGSSVFGTPEPMANLELGIYWLPEIDLPIKFVRRRHIGDAVSIGGGPPCSLWPMDAEPGEGLWAKSRRLRTAPEDEAHDLHSFSARIRFVTNADGGVVPVMLELTTRSTSSACGAIGHLVIEPID